MKKYIGLLLISTIFLFSCSTILDQKLNSNILIDNPNTGSPLESANELKPDDEIPPFDTLPEATIIETVNGRLQNLLW